MLNLPLRARSPSDMSESFATASLRRANVANLCGSSAEYSDSASRSSYSGATWVSPLVMVLITSVSGSMAAQQVSSAPIWFPITRMA